MSSAGILDRVSAAVWSDPWYDNKRERDFKDEQENSFGVVFHVGKEQHGSNPAKTLGQQRPAVENKVLWVFLSI